MVQNVLEGKLREMKELAEKVKQGEAEKQRLQEKLKGATENDIGRIVALSDALLSETGLLQMYTG